MFIFSLLQFRSSVSPSSSCLAPCRPGGHVLAFSLSLCRCTQTISVTYHILVPPPQQSASQSFAMLASFWTLFTVDFLHNFAAWLPVSGPRQFCSFCPPFLTFSAHLSFIHVSVCVRYWHSENMLWPELLVIYLKPFK